MPRYMQNIRPDVVWRKLFHEAGLQCVRQVLLLIFVTGFNTKK
jgi:hypothetical protein